MIALRARFFSFAFLPLAFGAVACRPGDDTTSSASEAAFTDASLQCAIEYQSLATGAGGPIANANGTLKAGIDLRGPTTAPYALSVHAFDGAPLSAQVEIDGPSGMLAYVLLPDSAFTKGPYAFELGAPIATTRANGFDGRPQDFDGVRGYCAIAGQPPPPAPDAGAGLDPKYFDPSLPNEDHFARHDPDPTKIDLVKLDALLAKAEAQGSDAVVITQNDVIVAEKYFGKGPQRNPVMSVTKSITAMAVGALLDEGKIASVDAPVSTWFPEWRAAPKDKVTLRHLLTMTSGIEDPPDLWNHDDLLAAARALPLSAAPGSTYSYSNASATLFAGIIAAAAGEPADAYVKRKFFDPIGITDAMWAKDAAGNVQTSGGLNLTPLDLLRLGAVVSHAGAWGDARLLGASWLAASTANETPLEACYGYLFWLVRPGCDGYHFGAAVPGGAIEGSFMDGWGGNYVAVVPSGGLVAVRTRYPGDAATVADEAATRYFGFTQDVAALAAK